MQRDSEFLATEKPSKLLLKLALPAVTAQLVNMLYNIVDRMYIPAASRASAPRRWPAWAPACP